MKANPSEDSRQALDQWFQTVELPPFNVNGPSFAPLRGPDAFPIISPSPLPTTSLPTESPVTPIDAIVPASTPSRLNPMVYWLGGTAAAMALALIVSMTAHQTHAVKEGASIAKALERAQTGDTIEIFGRHAGGFTIRRNITLKGRPGSLIAGGTSPLIRTVGARVRLEDLNIQQSNTNSPLATGVLTVESGRIEVNHCIVKGGRFGLAVKGDSAARVEGSTFEGAGLYGLVFLGRSTGDVWNSKARRNVNNGFGALDNATPRFEDNLAEDNGRAGIVFFKHARGSAVRNLCRRNGRHGIVVDAYAAPTLTGNRTIDNVGPGIGFYDHTGGRASGNEIHGNGSGGLLIKQQARPEVYGNQEYDNRPDTGEF